MSLFQEVLGKIENKQAVVGIVGLGYVGLPLAVEIAHAGYKTIGFDVQDKKVEMVHQNELLPLTGYIRGGCSPVGMKKAYPTFLDETAELYDEIAVSAGARGQQLILSPADLIDYGQLQVCDLTE